MNNDDVLVTLRTTRRRRREWQIVARLRGYDTLSDMIRDYLDRERELVLAAMPAQESIENLARYDPREEEER